MRWRVLRILGSVVSGWLEHRKAFRIGPAIHRKVAFDAAGEFGSDTGRRARNHLLHPHYLGMTEYPDDILADSGSEGDGDERPHGWLEVGIHEDAVQTDVAHQSIVFTLTRHTNTRGAMNHLTTAFTIPVVTGGWLHRGMASCCPIPRAMAMP